MLGNAGRVTRFPGADAIAEFAAALEHAALAEPVQIGGPGIGIAHGFLVHEENIFGHLSLIPRANGQNTRETREVQPAYFGTRPIR
jgi:hypothetical protein